MPIVVGNLGADERDGQYYGDGIARERYEDRIGDLPPTRSTPFGDDRELLACRPGRPDPRHAASPIPPRDGTSEAWGSGLDRALVTRRGPYSADPIDVDPHPNTRGRVVHRETCTSAEIDAGQLLKQVSRACPPRSRRACGPCAPAQARRPGSGRRR